MGECLLDAFDGRLRLDLVVGASEFLTRQGMDRRHDLIGCASAGATRGGVAMVGQIQRLTELDSDAVLRGGQSRTLRHDLVRADEAYGNNGCAGLEREEGDSRAPLVEATVDRACALRIQRDGAPRLEEGTLLVERIEGGLARTAANRDRPDRREELSRCPP